jgi:hypothetical protein
MSRDRHQFIWSKDTSSRRRIPYDHRTFVTVAWLRWTDEWQRPLIEQYACGDDGLFYLT